MRRSLWFLGVLFLVGCQSGRDALLADLLSDRPERRALAIRKLGEQAHLEDLVLFTRAARDQSPIVRGEAATALGESKSSDAVDPLSELVEDPDEQVQARAVEALSQMPGDKPQAYLTLEFGRRGRSTREAILAAFEHQGMANAADKLVEAEAKRIWDGNIQALNKGVLAERVSAAETIGRSGRPEAVALLLPLLRDRSIPVAAGAARGLGAAGDRRAIPALLAVLDETYRELREATVEGLRRFHSADIAPRLIALVQEHSAASGVAVQALAELPRTSEIDAALCAGILEGAQEIALPAAETMRQRGGCPPGPIAEALAPRAPKGRALNALRAVAILGATAKDHAALVADRLTSKDPEVVMAALSALEHAGTAEQAGAALSVYQAEWERISASREDWVRMGLPEAKKFRVVTDPTANPSAEKLGDLMGRLESLAETKRQESGRAPLPVPELVDDAEYASTAVAGAALRAVAALGAPTALTLVRRHIEDPAPTLHLAALVGAAHLGKEGAVLLVANLGGTSLEQRTEIAQALASAGESGKAVILEAIAHPETGPVAPFLEVLEERGAPATAIPLLEAEVRQGGTDSIRATKLLGEMRAPGATPLLLGVLRDPAMPSRREALLALGQIGDRSAAAEVGRELADENPEVRSAAAHALITLGGGAHKRMLQALTHDYYQSVREQAAAALAAAPAPSSGAER